MKRILVLGATGMLGNTILRYFAGHSDCVVRGTARTQHAVSLLPDDVRDYVVTGVDIADIDSLVSSIANFRPEIIINCIGLIKQLASASDPLTAIPVNSLIPHRLARLAAVSGARLVHISTDCVFNGSRGNYREEDIPDANDLYGRSKLLGEVDASNAITLRTSIIGHELGSAHGLIEWFRRQKGEVKGYARAIFSGLPTVELARVIAQFIIPNPTLTGLFHVSSAPIAKLDLLQLVGKAYSLPIVLVPDQGLILDRSLNSDRFRTATGYVSPSWPQLVEQMRDFG